MSRGNLKFLLKKEQYFYRSSFILLPHPLCSQNTGIENVSGIKYINFGTYDHNTTTIDGTIKDIFSKMPLDKYGIYVGAFRNANEFKIIIQSYQDRNYASAIVFSYAIGICFYKKVGGIVYKNTTNWDETLI